MVDGTRMQQRRATEAVWTTADYILAAGELGVTTDTGIIKIGNGVTPWTGLDPAFDSQYLPLLGTAANSSFLEGISASGFLKTADATTAATADKVALRLSDGRLKAATGTASDDLTTFAQMNAADVVAKTESIVRAVTSATTVATTDVSKMITVDHASLTAQVAVTVPTNATAAIPIGSWVDICAIGNGGVKITPTATVTVRGVTNVFPNYALVRILKIGTNEWLGIALSNQRQSRLPKCRLVRTGSTNYGSGTYINIPWDTLDVSGTPDIYNPDSEWFTVPGTGLPTARRLIVNKDGDYLVVLNFISSIATLTTSRINKLTADNVAGTVYASQPTYTVCNISARIRFTAGESIGASHVSTGGGDVADGTNGHRHDLTITRLGD